MAPNLNDSVHMLVADFPILAPAAGAPCNAERASTTNELREEEHELHLHVQLGLSRNCHQNSKRLGKICLHLMLRDGFQILLLRDGCGVLEQSGQTFAILYGRAGLGHCQGQTSRVERGSRSLLGSFANSHNVILLYGRVKRVCDEVLLVHLVNGVNEKPGIGLINVEQLLLGVDAASQDHCSTDVLQTMKTCNELLRFLQVQQLERFASTDRLQSLTKGFHCWDKVDA